MIARVPTVVPRSSEYQYRPATAKRQGSSQASRTYGHRQMTDMPRPSMLELDRLARSTVRDHSDRTLDELFPHLWAMRSERIDRHAPGSATLRDVLDRWRGRTWDVYLWETPRSFQVRRRCGMATLGELLWLADLCAAIGTTARHRRSTRPPGLSMRISRSGAMSLRRRPPRHASRQRSTRRYVLSERRAALRTTTVPSASMR